MFVLFSISSTGWVVRKADAGVSCLASVAAGPRRLAARPGENAVRRHRAEKGDDIIIKVPLGTVVTSDSGFILCELDQHNEVVTLAQGGEGGSALTNARHNGFAGDSVTVDLELKSIADIGLVGFPNAGKSSLLSSMSRVRGIAQCTCLLVTTL